MKIGIAGCGGIGSNVAMNLVRSGVTDFILVDFDRIEESNLNRQFFFKNQIGEYKSLELKKNLQAINENVSIESFVEKITEKNVKSFFKSCDIIVEAFDKKEFKSLLIENYFHKKIISANGIGGRDLEGVKVRELSNLIIVGDFISDISNYKTYSTKVNYISCIMANKILDIIGGFKDEKF